MTISGCDWGGRYASRLRGEGEENVQHLNHTLAVLVILPVLDFSPTGLLYSFEPGVMVLLKTWMTGSAENQLEEKWTEPWDVLLTNPHWGEVG